MLFLPATAIITERQGEKTLKTKTKPQFLFSVLTARD